MEKVVIGMSGGVDSSVAAIILKNQGYEVIGLFMRNWDASINNDILGNPTLSENICPQEQDYNDALAVCEKIDIPLYRVDFVKEYWDYVFSYFLDELKKGRTPNPDIMCNKYIKFDMFAKVAKEKFDTKYIATGHYARIDDEKLKRGVDSNKDQTYFLSQLSKKQLSNVLFPIGNLEKKEVRKIAENYGLITASKKDSTGICFIGERNFKQFLSNYLPNIPGNIILIEENIIIGKHVGLMYYTIGQRKGLNLGGNDDKLYVVGKNIDDNILYVSKSENNDFLLSDSCIVDTLNWISETKPNKCSAKFRYRQVDNEVEIEYLSENEILVKYPQKIKSVTPGQACVFYLDDECLGGGIIKEVKKNNEKLWYL
ncbi:MAG: tRNA 2-thiouridine(34) synthase MnmA [Bacilli bacterium]